MRQTERTSLPSGQYALRRESMQTNFSRPLITTVVGLVLFAASCTTPPPAAAPPQAQANSAGLPAAAQLKTLLKNAASTAAPNGDAGGLFHGERMWGAVVNREGKLCAVAASQDDATQVWPGSQAIAKD